MANANSAEISIASNVHVWHQKSPKSTFISNNNNNNQIEAKPAIIIAVIKQNHTNTQRTYAGTHKHTEQSPPTLFSFLLQPAYLMDLIERKNRSDKEPYRIQKIKSNLRHTHHLRGRTTKNTIIICVVRCCCCVCVCVWNICFLPYLFLFGWCVLLHTRKVDRATRREKSMWVESKNYTILCYWLCGGWSRLGCV